MTPALGCILLLAACEGAKLSPTPTSLPAVTPTFLIPDLESVLLRTSSLPARVTSAEISYTPHPSLADLPDAQYFVSLQFLQGTQFGGRVSVFLYANPADMDAAWPAILNTIATPKEIDDIGDLAVVNFSDLVFIRCTALVHIKLVGTQPEELRIYASQLDARFTPLVCQP